MKAIVYEQYGPPDVLQFREVEDPVIGDEDVLIKICAAAANPYDWHFVRGEPYFMRLVVGLRRPKSDRLGADFAGFVQSTGKNVTQFKPGDAVFGMGNGAYAEYLVCKEQSIVPKPASMTFEQAAAIPMAGLTALQGLRDTGQLQPNQRVLIIGASGGVGTFAVQIAKEMGAHVTGVCSAKNLDMVRSLGADDVIDYTQEDFAQLSQKSGKKYDLIFQLGGMHSPAHCRRALVPDGILALSSGDSNGRLLGPLDRIINAAILSPFVSQTLSAVNTKRSKEDLAQLAALFDAGKLTPVIDRTYPLHEVPEAIRYVEQGHSRGKVVITVAEL